MRDAFYAGALPPEASSLLEEAMSHYTNTEKAESLLRKALAAYPDALPLYFSMYKFLFYKGRLQEAEQAARSALETAAEQGGFPNSYETLTPEIADWTRYDSPQHFYLFSLKALAFIRLRLGDSDGCERMLSKLRELDSADTIGGSVIGALAAGL